MMRMVVDVDPKVLARDIVDETLARETADDVVDLIEHLDCEMGEDEVTLDIIKRLLVNVQANVKPDELIETLTNYVNEIEQQHYANDR